MSGQQDIAGSLSRWAYRLAAGTLGALGVKAAIRTHVLPRLLRAAQSSAPGRELTGLVEKHVEEEIARAVATPGPILVGPWLSEVGFEILYWIPMLRWIKETWAIPEERLVVVSRGGTRLWYEGLCGRYVDILDLVSPEAFQELNQARWKLTHGQKQAFVEDQDRDVIARVREAAGIEGEAVLHPSLMYSLFWPVFQRHAPAGDVMDRVRFAALPRAALTPDLRQALPEDYVAMRFYFRPSLPDTKANRDFVVSITERVARQHPVVLLNTGLRLDDHTDFAGAGAVTLDRLMTPSTNLDVQTRVIANARGFVGTYGGLSYLAPFMGVPSIAFHSSEQDLIPAHLEVARTACRGLGAGLVALSTADLGAIDALLGPAPAASGAKARR